MKNYHEDKHHLSSSLKYLEQDIYWNEPRQIKVQKNILNFKDKTKKRNNFVVLAQSWTANIIATTLLLLIGIYFLSNIITSEKKTTIENREPVIESEIKTENLYKDEIYIPLNLQESVSEFKGEPQLKIENRPGGKLFVALYPTLGGDILVSQGVNSHQNVGDMLNEVKSWYPPENIKELDVSGNQAILDESESTIHIITKDHIYTVAGSKDGTFLLKVANLIKYK